MTAPSSQAPTPKRALPGASVLTIGGLAAAFGLASCCALAPFLATPHRSLLMAVGAVCLLGGALLLWREQPAAAACPPGRGCTPPWVRVLTLIGLLAGAGLLRAGCTYV